MIYVEYVGLKNVFYRLKITFTIATDFKATCDPIAQTPFRVLLPSVDSNDLFLTPKLEHRRRERAAHAYR